MAPSRPIRLLFLATMLGSMAVVLAWAGWIGWREWPRWWAVREMRAAVVANEPARFLDAIERVDSLGAAEAAADEIAPLRLHPDPRVRMYAIMARTVLGPRGPKEAKELIELFDDHDEDIAVRCAAAYCLIPFGEKGRTAVPYLFNVAKDDRDPRSLAAKLACQRLGYLMAGYTVPPLDLSASLNRQATMRDWADRIINDAAQ